MSRSIKPLDTAVVSVTCFHGGEAFNVIPDRIRIAGTVRYFRPEVGQTIKRRMEEILSGIATAHDVAYVLDYVHGYPPTINAEANAAFLKRVAADAFGPERVIDQEAVMGAEDFSFFLRERPGAYAFIGNGGPESANKGICLHNPHYDFNDGILPVGATLFVRLVEETLKG